MAGKGVYPLWEIIFILAPSPVSSKAWYLTLTTGCPLYADVVRATVYSRQEDEGWIVFGLLQGCEEAVVVAYCGE